MLFISVMQSWILTIVTPGFSVKYADLETCQIIIYIIYAYIYSGYIDIYLMHRMFKRTAFIWNVDIFNRIKVITVSFETFNLSLLNINLKYM